MDLQIEGRHVAITSEWRRAIEARVADLHPGHNDVTHVRVTLTKQDHKRAEDSCEALVVVQVPRHTLTARKQAESFEEAFRDAFSAMDIELDKLSEKRGAHCFSGAAHEEYAAGQARDSRGSGRFAIIEAGRFCVERDACAENRITAR